MKITPIINIMKITPTTLGSAGTMTFEIGVLFQHYSLVRTLNEYQ